MKNKDLLKEKSIIMWNEDKIEAFQKTLLDWYDANKRDLPWRRTSNPYYIWISEIMLQQTQVDTVIPYYERFINTLPEINDLAEASEDTLLKLWEGLGYYSRVRNMKVAAGQIMADHNGIFPEDYEAIKSLKGIGPYTAGAVSSIAFNQPQPAVDGNVMRVLSRLFEIELDIGKPSSRKVFEEMIRLLIDRERPGDFNQALMDLGATICTPKNYKPETSPVKDFNASYLNETWERYPIKQGKKKVREEAYIALAVSNDKGEYLFQKRGSEGVLSGMWTFLMIPADILDEDGWKSFGGSAESLTQVQSEILVDYIKKEYGLIIAFNNSLKGTYTHIFSHLKWHLSIYEAKVVAETVTGHSLHPIHPDDFSDIAFPVPTQKVWNMVNAITLF
ncbi:A/G-specific adenine glycosylase [Alkalibacterium pelagium]|jgi:A/G-specific adenine glycosylase|nr:A/G-specific adenine glycosylase [Alkalibacterium pelagium]